MSNVRFMSLFALMTAFGFILGFVTPMMDLSMNEGILLVGLETGAMMLFMVMFAAFRLQTIKRSMWLSFVIIIPIIGVMFMAWLTWPRIEGLDRFSAVK